MFVTRKWGTLKSGCGGITCYRFQRSVINFILLISSLTLNEVKETLPACSSQRSLQSGNSKLDSATRQRSQPRGHVLLPIFKIKVRTLHLWCEANRREISVKNIQTRREKNNKKGGQQNNNSLKKYSGKLKNSISNVFYLFIYQTFMLS